MIEELIALQSFKEVCRIEGYENLEKALDVLIERVTKEIKEKVELDKKNQFVDCCHQHKCEYCGAAYGCISTCQAMEEMHRDDK